MQKRMRVILGSMILPALFLLALLLFARPPDIQVAAQSGVSNFTTVKASRDVMAGRDITAARNITAGDDVAAGNFFNAAPQTGITLTMNGWLTPTGSLQLIQSAGAVSISGGRIAPLKDGDLLILLNVGANTITFTETTGLVSANNIALGALDSAMLVRRGSSWYQVAASNN